MMAAPITSVHGLRATRREGAVEARALAVSPAYEAHARELDEQYSRPQVRIQGPDGTWQSVPDASQPAGDGIRRLLGSFTRVRGLVFGQYGEWSLDVSHLISISAAPSWHLQHAAAGSLRSHDQ